MRTPLFVAVLALVAGCASAPSPASSDLTALDQAAMFPVGGPTADQNYRIGPTDLLSLSVFQVKDLSFAEIRVDASGNLDLPLIGAVKAADRTPTELSEAIEAALGVRYLRDPQVSVSVLESASQKVTVDGAVRKPGIYQMRGRTSLMQAVAMAEGPGPSANLKEVAVFRTVNGRRMVALFDLTLIRAGLADDPMLMGDDTVVVDTSRLNAMIREVITALPGLAAFGYLR